MNNTGLEVAIIGLSGRFPGAKNIHEFWQNLQNGVESISFFSDAELQASGIKSEVLNHPNYVKAGSVLEDIDLFDAAFFGFNPREAEIMDPQQRLFLECAWEALENAGYASGSHNSAIGVYGGVSLNTYLLNNLYTNRELLEATGTYQTLISNDKDFLTTWVSYKLNLQGPSVAVQTACSTSLVAVHLACQGLLNGECDLALAGGVSISIPHTTGYVYQEGGILSPDGHCRPFDAQAQGTINGNGAGIVVLKRLEDALTDGDQIYAVIKGSAINNDGSLKVGYTAPRVDGQAKVIRAAQEMAEVEPETISYIETHGTGTILGDPIEITALTQAFRVATEKKGFCAIGSLKSNIGHLDAASGVAGLIKTVLALKHKQLPPSLHFEQPNTKIDFANSPFYVNTQLSAWEANQNPRRAGVSSFGIGGTNAHIILEEAPELEIIPSSKPAQLLLLSAKTSSALANATTNLVEYLKQNPDLNFADVAYTLQVGRKAFNHRLAVVCHNLAAAVQALENFDIQHLATNLQEEKKRLVTFMFPGQGSQYLHMARELYQTEKIFQQQVDDCCELLKPDLGFDLRTVLYPSSEIAAETTQQINQTAIAQPALFVIEYALAKLWMAWGINPQAMIGHSIGEYVAACLAGVFSLEAALRLVAARGRMMQALPSGAMIAVQLSENELLSLLNQKLSIAAINSPGWCTISGTIEAIEVLEQLLTKREINYRRLHTSHAFHSAMMEPILAEFQKLVSQVNLSAPQIPYISNLTGTWITDTQATNPNYWTQHLRGTVRFADGLQELFKEPNRILLEVGAGETLSTLAKRHPDKTAESIILSSVRHPQNPQSDITYLQNSLGQLWLAGIQINWSEFYADEQRYRLPLPTYPFERQRFWIEPQTLITNNSELPGRLTKNSNIAEWFYFPSWKRSPAVKMSTEKHQKWLVFVDDYGLGSALVKQLAQAGDDVIRVKVGQEFAKIGDGIYTICPSAADDYDTLFQELRSLEKIPQAIAHFWSVSSQENGKLDINFDSLQKLGFYSLLFLAGAIAKQNLTDSVQIGVVSHHLHDITGTETLCPEQATVLGPCKVINQEYLNITCQNIDVLLPAAGSWQEERLIKQIIAEFTAKPSDLIVAYRGDKRWVQTFESMPLDHNGNSIGLLRQNGVYLIIDGLTGLGLLMSEYLAKTVQAKLILIERLSFPEKDEWEKYLAINDNDISRKIAKVKALEALGAEVLIININPGDRIQLQADIDWIYEVFGELNGVIHTVDVWGEQLFNPIQEIEPIKCERHFQLKVHELVVLAEVLQDKQIDFCLLQSSLSAVLGGLGFVADAAANLFVDTLVNQHNQTSAVPWISVNWDMWQFDSELENSALGSNFTELAMTSQECLDILNRIFALDAGTQVIISTGNLSMRLNQWVKLESLRNPDLTKKVNPNLLHSRPILQNAYVAPSTDLEETITSIWQQLLGIEKIGIYDNFFELGGHSLLATQLISRLRDVFQVNLSLSSLFEAASVQALSELIEEKLIEKIEGLSDEEIASFNESRLVLKM
jgi:acyl transferase domain-containing protein/acyl carrier protein